MSGVLKEEQVFTRWKGGALRRPAEGAVWAAPSRSETMSWLEPLGKRCIKGEEGRGRSRRA